MNNRFIPELSYTIINPQVSQLLLAIEGGKVNKWKGKKLADIAIEGKYVHYTEFALRSNPLCPICVYRE